MLVRASSLSVPLSLALHSQVGTGLLPGDLQTSPQHKPLQDLHEVHGQVPAEQRLGLELALRLPHQHPVDGHGGIPE
jgi:hypothetical protein